MKIVIPGGSGQIGTLLARAYHARADEVVVLSRRPRDAAWRVEVWDGATIGAWADEIDGADVVLNLAGRSVNCRYTAANRDAIMRSRIDSTRVVGQAIATASRPPGVWLQASTATIYAHRFDAANDETTGIIGGDEPDAPDTWRFSIDVATSWEREAAVGAEALPEVSKEGEKNPETALQPSRCPDSERLAHQQPEVEATAVNEQPFEDVVVTAKMSAPHASCSVEVREGSLGSFPRRRCRRWPRVPRLRRRFA